MVHGAASKYAADHTAPRPENGPWLRKLWTRMRSRLSNPTPGVHDWPRSAARG